MSNSSPKNAIITHHDQVNKARSKKAELAKLRRMVLELKVAGIKATLEGRRETLVIATLAFLLGLISVFFLLIYIVGAILYG